MKGVREIENKIARKKPYLLTRRIDGSGTKEDPRS
jgi:hypothetical protein